jgi:hypothetical protein
MLVFRSFGQWDSIYEMARDPELERRIEKALAREPNVERKAMFGGIAWLMNGNLLLAASHKGLLARLGAGSEAWALDLTDVRRMEMRGRELPGWVRAGEDAISDKEVLDALVARAVELVRTLPPKAATNQKRRPARKS